MKPTGTPAYKPTADSIWNSFLTSNKRHLILTGSRGAGKSTRLDRLRGNMPGIQTRAVPGSGVYLETHPGGDRVQIGVYDSLLPGPANRMRPCTDALEHQAACLIHQLAQGTEPWVFVDEIGYLESASAACMDALRKLFDSKRVIAAVRRQDEPFLLELRQRPDAFCVDLDAPFGNTACVIMASGQSRRFGGNKLLADFHGAPLFMRILTATEGIFHRRVVVTRHPEIVQLCREAGTDVILHDLPHRSDTVRLGLEAVSDSDGCLFCPADQPLLTKDTIAALVLAAVHDPRSIHRPCFGENPGSPVLFPRWAFPELMTLPEGKGGGHVMRLHPDCVRTLPVRNEWELMDADDRETLALLLKLDPKEP